MLKVTIELPETVGFFNSDDHKLAELSFKDMADSGVLAKFLSGASGAVVKALRIPAMNAYNSGGSKASKAEKQAALDKRLAAWKRGEWAITERGEAIMTVYRDEVYIPMSLEQGMTLAAAEKHIRDKVKEYFPPETKATFANFMLATAIEQKAEFGDDQAAALEAVEAFYESELERRRAEIAKRAAKVESPKIDLSKFKKKATK